MIRARVRPPPLPTPLLARPRVEDTLAGLIASHPHTCVYATAGAGKTTAVLQAARAIDRPLAWLGVDRTDAATGQLLTYLEAALAAAVPAAAGLATSAIAAGVPHREAAGLLAETVGETPLLLVVDDLERLADSPEALDVLGSFLRYLPPAARTVLVARVDVPIDLGSGAIGRLAGLDESDLAFTANEVGAALAAAGSPRADADAAWKATGGWVAGVMFEAWRSAEHVPGMGGEADPLHGYLSSQILAALPDAEQDFLIVTSVLDQVTGEAAVALGVEDGPSLIRSVRRRHLPASWDTGPTMRCHPRFREYLLELLDRCPVLRAQDVRRRHGLMLADAGHLEEAVGELIGAGALAEALEVAERCIEAVVDRADLLRAEHWLEALAPVRARRSTLAPAELMLAVAREDYRRGVRLAGELAEAGDLADVASSSSRAGSAMAWSHLHAGDLESARAVLALTAPGPPRDAMSYCLTLVSDEPPGTPPTRALSGGSFDALVMRVHYYRGYFGLLMQHPLEGWAARAGDSWRIGAMVDMGRTEEALRLFEAVSDGQKGAWFSAILNAHLLGRLGRTDDARLALRAGRERLRRSGSVMLEMISQVEEAELELRAGHADVARAILGPVLDAPTGRAYRYIYERARTGLGFALLLQKADAEAAACLREVVATTSRTDRVYSLPAAAVYLAEAEWRLDDLEQADLAADVALDAARRQGSYHLLLEALQDFPGVLSRRLDAETGRDSEWHTLGRSLPAGRDLVTVVGPTRVELTEFGTTAISVDGTEVRPRIRKSHELLAYLASTRSAEATRDQLLGALFDGRTDASATAYLRQAVHKLRLVLPADVPLVVDAGRVRLGPGVTLTSESTRFEDLFVESAALHHEDRLAGLRRALEIADRGEYLPGVRSEWVEHRRSRLTQRATAARFEAAETAYALERLGEAEELLAVVLRADPLQEPAWRLAMRLADAVGDENRVLTTYRDCEAALAEIAAQPSAATRALLASLHH